MKHQVKILVNFLLMGLIGLSFQSQAQSEKEIPAKDISYAEFMQRLGKYNLDYNAQLLDLNQALAEEESAKVFEDPVLSFEATDNGQRRMQMGYEFETGLEWTLELGGKRKARMNAARNQTELTRILLADYFHQLRADASIQFLEVIKEKKLLEVKKSSYESIQKLAYSDSIRFQLGDIMEIDARQSKLEAVSVFNEVVQQEADWESALMEVNQLIGIYNTDSLTSPHSTYSVLERNYEINKLDELAQEHRKDLKIALQDRNLSKSLVQLVRAERSLDLDLSLGIGNTTVVTNIVAPTPSMASVTAGIAVPLKLSNRNKGELKAAQYALEQSELNYKSTQMNLRTEVKKALLQYNASKKQVEQFDADVLKSAQRILDGKTYSYQRGETSLLEVLEAQRTFNETQENYYESLYRYGVSLIELQRVVGIWDIKL